MENKKYSGTKFLHWLNPLEPWQWGMAVVIFMIVSMIYIAHN